MTIDVRAEEKITTLKPGLHRDAYLEARHRLIDFLIRHSLLGSYRNFRHTGRSYPFVGRREVMPCLAGSSLEHGCQNTALIFLLDGELPRGLNKHFRLRGSTRVSWRNLQRLARHVDFADYKAAHCRLDAPEAESLLERLCGLDYALMIGRPGAGKDEEPGPCEITHMHVKVERLTDNAIKELGKELGYIERRLFERGEDYVDALETKFYEYYGFAANASGRRSAAAIAAQLFAKSRIRFSVFVASSEDTRLGILDDSELLTQYLLLRAEMHDIRQLGPVQSLAPYVLFEDQGLPVMLYRVRFRRTAAARPAPGHSDRCLDVPWLEIADESLLSSHATTGSGLPIAWASEPRD